MNIYFGKGTNEKRWLKFFQLFSAASSLFLNQIIKQWFLSQDNICQMIFEIGKFFFGLDQTLIQDNHFVKEQTLSSPVFLRLVRS